MKRVRCRFGVVAFVSLFLALGMLNLAPGAFLNEASFAKAAVNSAMTSDVNKTVVIMPPHFDFTWGWAGIITFVYWDVALDTGIANATVTCQGWFPELDIFDYNNGSYFFFLNTTEQYAKLDPYILILTFEKENHESQVVGYVLWIHPVPTEALIQVPEYNVNGSILDLIVPVGDTLDIRFYYNDTDASDGYVGGLPGAHTSATLYGPTLVRKDSTLNDLDNGNYSYLFDTNESWLFEATGRVPFPHELPYYLDVEIGLENRWMSEAHVRIYIVETPTELEAMNFEDTIEIEEGDTFIASLRYSDVWPGHGSVPISNANVTVENPIPEFLEILSIEEDEADAGVYHIEFKCTNLDGFQLSEILTINLEKLNFETQTLTVQVELYKPPIDLTPPVPWWWRLAPLVAFAFAIYYHRRTRRELDSASAPDDASNYPDPSPDTLKEHGTQDTSAGWYYIYLILLIWIWIAFTPRM